MVEEPVKKGGGSEVVTDRGGSRWSDLFRLEDYWAIWLGFALIVAGMLIFFPRPPEGMRESIAAANSAMARESESAPFKTVEWHRASDSKKKIKASGEDYAKKIGRWLDAPHGWKGNPADAFYMSGAEAEAKNAGATEKYEAAKGAADEALEEAIAAENRARLADFKDTELNEGAKAAIGAWREAKEKESSAKKKTQATAFSLAGNLAVLCVALAVFFGVGMLFMGKPVGRFAAGFPLVFVLAVLSLMLKEQATMKEYGIGYAAWAILFGLLISNTVGTPKWAMPAVQTEYYIKTGLVLLGAEILFGKIVSIGIPGIFVAWVVTPIVLVTTFIFGQRVLKMESKTLNITISADMSVCGVSAAIATAAACRAKKEELTLAVGMSLVFTSIMMIVIPNVVKAVGMDHVLGGAWMGGTIDATGAVAAAGAFLSERALYVAATIKMIQNVLIGVIAFCVAVYWCARVDCAPGRRVSWLEIWYRFPKFVLGFIAASVIFSLIYQSMGADAGYTMIEQGVIRGFTRNFREWFFCLAFVSIGLATDFRELGKYFKGG
ncbi:MAG: putative sulfate exporter family transporter, partial [bacterium]